MKCHYPNFPFKYKLMKTLDCHPKSQSRGPELPEYIGKSSQRLDECKRTSPDGLTFKRFEGWEMDTLWECWIIKIFKGKFAQDEITHQRLRVGSKKSVQQGRSRFYARSVRLVREHGKMARTPLAAFFNRPTIAIRRWRDWETIRLGRPEFYRSDHHGLHPLKFFRSPILPWLGEFKSELPTYRKPLSIYWYFSL